MKKKKVLGILLALAMCSGTLTACGGNPSENTGDADSASAEETGEDSSTADCVSNANADMVRLKQTASSRNTRRLYFLIT